MNDVHTRLRVILWLLVLSLWGTMVYQYLGEGDLVGEQMHWIANPFKKPKPPAAAKASKSAEPAPVAEESSTPETVESEPSTPEAVPPTEPASVPQTVSSEPTPPGAEGAPAPSEDPAVVASAQVVPLPAPWATEPSGGPKLASAAPPGNFIKPLPPKLPKQTERPRQPIPKSLRRHEQVPPPVDAPVPKGFSFTKIRHFNVYSEGEPASEEFLDTLEKLYANLMLDLAAFSPWAREERVNIFLFRNQDSYRRVTGRPAWSGGASSVSKRKIYLYESEELVGILAHELCHIYFDGFFVGGKNNPLWLSEGLATLVQVERGLASPNWLPENLDVLSRGGGFNFDDLMRVEETSGANDDNVRLWYTQSYSVVRFLIRSQWKSSFYHFCRFLREGRPVQEALYRAYGMPFNRVKALEYAWRYDIQTRRISSLRDQ